MSMRIAVRNMPVVFTGATVLLFALSTPALAATPGVRLDTTNASQTSIYIEYELEESTDGVDAICAILDYDYTDGFYSIAPQENSRRQVLCNSNLRHSHLFQGLESDTTYWLSLYPYKMGGQGFVLPSNAYGIAGKEVKTEKASVAFSASANDISASSVTLTTARYPESDEYYGASCSPYTGWENSDEFTKSTSIVVKNLQPNTRYTCRIYVYPSASGGHTIGTSSDVVFTTLKASPNPNTPPTANPRSTIPPAGYEDEVLTIFSAYVNPFPDTDLDAVSGKAAAELYRRSVIGGFPDGEFKGDRPVNRAEAAKFLLLARFQAVADVSNNGTFPDVVDDQWYTKFVVTASQKGIINGYPDGWFRPADQVNTAEFLKMLSRTFNLPLNMTSSYYDVPSDSWFAPYAGIAQQYDLFPGRTSYLSPETQLTRADVAIAIYQYLSQR